MVKFRPSDGTPDPHIRKRKGLNEEVVPPGDIASLACPHCRLCRRGHTHADANPGTHVHTYGHTLPNSSISPSAYSYTKTHCNGDAPAKPNSHANPYTNAYSDSYANCHTRAN